MNKYQYEIMYKLEEVYWWFRAKKYFIYSVYKNHKKPKLILDIGCGTGGTSQFLDKWGLVTRVEPSIYAHPFLKKRKINFNSCSIETFNSKPETYDAVFLLDVLYHKNIKDDIDVLQKVYRVLKPGGTICITDCSFPKLWSYHDVQVQARVRYSKKDLLKKIKNSNFTIKKVSYIYFFTFPLFLIQRLYIRFFPTDTVTRLPKYINSILLITCKIESKLLEYVNFPFGSSIIILAQKKPTKL